MTMTVALSNYSKNKGFMRVKACCACSDGY